MTVKPVGIPFLSRPAKERFVAFALTAAAFAFAAAVAAALAEGEELVAGVATSFDPATSGEET